MDLFPTKGTSREPPKTTAKSDFMADLFGEKKTKSSTFNDSVGTSKIPESSPTTSQPPARAGRRRGNPVMGQQQQQPPPNSTDLMSSMAALESPTVSPAKQSFSAATPVSTGTANPDHEHTIRSQMSEMHDFESRQMEQFQKDLQDQQKMMEVKQREYQVVPYYKRIPENH